MLDRPVDSDPTLLFVLDRPVDREPKPVDSEPTLLSVLDRRSTGNHARRQRAHVAVRARQTRRQRTKPVDSEPTLLSVLDRPVDSELTLLFVLDRPVDSEPKPVDSEPTLLSVLDRPGRQRAHAAVVLDRPVDREPKPVDSEPTLLSVLDSPVDRNSPVDSELTLLFVLDRPVDSEPKPVDREPTLLSVLDRARRQGFTPSTASSRCCSCSTPRRQRTEARRQRTDVAVRAGQARRQRAHAAIRARQDPSTGKPKPVDSEPTLLSVLDSRSTGNSRRRQRAHAAVRARQTVDSERSRRQRSDIAVVLDRPVDRDRSPSTANRHCCPCWTGPSTGIHTRRQRAHAAIRARQARRQRTEARRQRTDIAVRAGQGPSTASSRCYSCSTDPSIASRKPVDSEPTLLSCGSPSTGIYTRRQRAHAAVRARQTRRQGTEARRQRTDVAVRAGQARRQGIHTRRQRAHAAIRARQARRQRTEARRQRTDIAVRAGQPVDREFTPVDSELTLLFVLDRPVDSEPKPVDSEPTLLSVLDSPVDREFTRRQRAHAAVRARQARRQASPSRCCSCPRQTRRQRIHTRRQRNRRCCSRRAIGQSPSTGKFCPRHPDQFTPVDSELTLLFVLDRPVDSEPKPVDSEPTLLSVLDRPVDRESHPSTASHAAVRARQTRRQRAKARRQRTDIAVRAGQARRQEFTPVDSELTLLFVLDRPSTANRRCCPCWTGPSTGNSHPSTAS